MINTSFDELDEFLYSIWNFYAANLSPRTSRNYYNIVKGYIKFTGKTPLKLTFEDADKYNQYLIERVKIGKLSYATAVMRISVMRSLCEYIRIHQNKLNIDYTNHFNDIILPDADKTIYEENIPSAEELNELLSYVKKTGDESSYLIFALVIKCGLTSSEVCNLNYEYLVFDSKDHLCISFPAKKRISRIIRIPSDISKLIINYINNNSINAGPLFFNKHNTQLKVRDAERILKKYIEECMQHCSVMSTFTLQQMRHAALKYMLQGGASEENVAKYCGITTKWMSRYKRIVEDSAVITTADMSVISIKGF